MRVSPWLCVVLLAAACDFDSGGSDLDGGVTIDAIDATVVVGDTDLDGILDEEDNCRTTFNLDQHDEDADGVGDACDNCPTVANQNQANVRETGAGAAADAVGDACDPFPERAGNSILFFDGFATRDPLWRVAPGGGSWNVVGDAMEQSTASVVSYLFYAGDLHGDLVIDFTARIIGVPTGAVGLGSIAQWSQGLGDGAGYLCQLYDTPAGALNVGDFLLRSSVEPLPLASRPHDSLVPAVTAADAWTLRQFALGSQRSCAATSSAGFSITTPTVTNTDVVEGRFGFRAVSAMRYENVIVYTVGS